MIADLEDEMDAQRAENESKINEQDEMIQSKFSFGSNLYRPHKCQAIP